MDDHDARISKVEARVDNMEKACDRLANSIDALRAEMNQRISELRTEFIHAIDRLREEHNRNFRWLVGIVIANLVINAGIMARMAKLI